MTNRTASASGKIILSGEYAVLFGYAGIAIPSELKINITMTASQKNDAPTVEWNEKNLDPKWQTYAENIAHLISKKSGVTGHYIIDNHLPLGKGMGSSTALIIAMTRAACDSENIAREIEDEVNIGHSGLDFAVISAGKPVLYKKSEAPTVIDLPKNLLTDLTLIDTGMPNETTPELVAWVKSRYEHTPQEESCSLISRKDCIPGSGFLPAVDVHTAIKTIGQCTERILAGEDLKAVLRDHHKAQIALGIVPQATQDIIVKIEQEGGSAKIIGAGARTGGGGMVLVIR